MTSHTPSPVGTDIDRAVDLLQQCDALVIGAGAGIGIDSGLPDFRGQGGFWGAYPALGRAGLRFESIANPEAFQRHPKLAWGFYGHRLAMYRKTQPHAGFGILRQWSEQMLMGGSVFTSNVDGHFLRAGFNPEHVHECHGSIHHLQCLNGCGDHIWPADEFEPEVDEQACLLINEPPRCPRCNSLARPNILMFGDHGWVDRRQAVQARAQERWISRTFRPLVIEIGAGIAIPSVRHFSHHVILRYGGRLIRINPTDCTTPTAQDVGLALPALKALELIENRARERSPT